MAVSDTAKLIVDLSLKGNFAKSLSGATKSLDKFTAGESRAYKAGAQIGTGIKRATKLAAVGVGILASQVALGLDSLIELEKATAQTEAVIKSTGGSAGITAKQVNNLAEKFESLNATVGDEFIQAGENMLLTFTNIRGKAFEPALQAILDLNTAMGKGPEGLTSTAIQVGKALNDPTKGLTALRKVGVSFTDQQQKKIKSLQKEGKLYEAQQIILKELNREFGGSFAAQGDTTAGKVAKFTDAVEDLQRSLATALLPTVSNVADALSSFLADPAVVRGAEELGTEIGKLFSKENIASGINVLKGFLNTAREVAPIVAAAAKTMGTFISAAVKAFQSLPPEIQKLAVGAFAVNKLTGGLVTNIGGGLISAILGQLKSAVVTVHGGVVNVSGPGGVGAGGAAGAGGGIGSALKTSLALVLPAIAAAIASNEITTETNKGLGTKFVAPGSGGIGPMAIVTGLINLGEIIKLATGQTTAAVNAQKATEVQEASKTTTAVEKMRGNLVTELNSVKSTQHDSATKQSNAIENVRKGIGADLSKIHTAALDAKTVASGAAKTAVAAKASTSAGLISAGLAAKRAGETASSATRVATSGAATRITAAIRASRPITNVNVHVNATTVTKSVTVVSRYGPSGGSGSTNSRYGSVPT